MKIISATLKQFDPSDQGVVTVEFIDDKGETGELSMQSGTGIPSSRLLQYVGISMSDYTNDIKIVGWHGKEIPCSESVYFNETYFETDNDLFMAQTLINSINENNNRSDA